MAGKSEQRQRLRLFVALDLPAELREGIAAWGARELRDPALRPVAVESLHITLAFLGQRDVGEVEALEAAMSASAGQAAAIELCDPEPRPPRGRPRLFALPARSEGAVALHGKLTERLVTAGLYEAEERPFWPHVTVARVRSRGQGSRQPARVGEGPKYLLPGLSERRFCRRMTLYRSQLQPRGARYVPLAQVELPAAGGSEVI